MKAAVLDSTAHLTIRDLPDPAPGPGEVTVAVSLAGVGLVVVGVVRFTGSAAELKSPGQ